MKIIQITGKDSKLRLYKKFSFPYRFGNMPDLAWFEKHHQLINDVYINPDIFGVDLIAMNGPDLEDDRDTLAFLKELRGLGIKICCTFNNIFADLSPNLYLDMEPELRELIDIIVIPDMSWLVIKEHTDVELRNTLINDVGIYDIKNNPDYSKLDCIYIHGENLRNVEKYKDIKNLGAVVNFNDCVSYCTVKHQHYSAINKSKFTAEFCPTAKMTYLERILKVNRIPPFRSEYIFYEHYLKIFKLQGRGTTDTFEAAISIIENLHNKQEHLTKEADIIDIFLKGLESLKWRNLIRNCGGDCSQCDKCNEYLK